MPDIRHSVCALDCPDCCSLLLTVEDGRATRLRGNPEHPVTRGFLCGKVAQYLEREYHPERLLYPKRRVGAKGSGRFERIGWDEALDTIAARLRGVADEFGSEAILPYSYAGTMGLLNGSGMDRRFFHRLGASRLDRTICSSAGMVGMTQALGVRYATEPEQFRHSKLILAWGANILGTNVHLWPFVMEARRNGAKLYTIDPNRNRTGAASDKHFFINPGSDTALALAMMHVIIGEGLHDADYVERYTNGFAELRERVLAWTPQRAAELTGIAAGEIVQLAREYATTRPAAIRLNYGVQRSERGATAVRTIGLLPALVGSWREVGGGIQLSTSQAFQLNRAGLERADLQQASLGREARIVNMTLLGQALTTLDEPPVKAMVVYNSNPAAIAPDQNAVLNGLRREDLFTVVLEQFQTDTADYADIVLPVTVAARMEYQIACLLAFCGGSQFSVGGSQAACRLIDAGNIIRQVYSSGAGKARCNHKLYFAETEHTLCFLDRQAYVPFCPHQKRPQAFLAREHNTRHPVRIFTYIPRPHGRRISDASIYPGLGVANRICHDVEKP